jgi:hypothetical protein
MRAARRVLAAKRDAELGGRTGQGVREACGQAALEGS